jgi:catechol-2,3-dioxygenase
MALKGVLRPGYIQIRVTDLDAALKHYVDRVGLHQVSREPDGRVYLRAWDEFDRHSIVLRRDGLCRVQGGQAADIIARYDISLDIGPTRHGITRGQTIYFFDPAGNRNEVFSGGFIYYPDNPKRVWSIDQIGKAIFYYQRELNERFMSVVT